MASRCLKHLCVLQLVCALSCFAQCSPVGPKRLVVRAAGMMEIADMFSLTNIFARQGGRGTASSVNDSVISTVVPTLLPDEPPDMHITETLSIFVFWSNFTTEINDACILCFANATETSTSLWGMFNATQPANNILQLEYYVNVPVNIANETFHGAVNDLLRDINDTSAMTDCVREQNVGLASGAVIRAGKAISEREGVEYTVTDSSLKSWIPGAVIGAVALLTMLVLVVFARKSNAERHEPEEYQQAETEQPPPPRAGPTEEELLEQMA